MYVKYSQYCILTQWCDKIQYSYDYGEAKPKISFPFLFPLRGGGVGGGGARKIQGNFLVFAHTSPRAWPRRASLVVRIQFKIHSNFVQYTPPKFGIRRNGQSGGAPKARHYCILTTESKT